jgi:hypothetical protein
MKIADMMEAYAQATGNRIMHHIGVAEVLVQLIESSRASRAEATEQFREAMLGYVNESIDIIKAADTADKDELAKAVRKLIADMHADRHDILEGEPPHTPSGEAGATTLTDDHLGYGHKTIEGQGESFESLTDASGFGGEKGEGGEEPTSGKEGRGRGVKHAA